MWTAAVRNTSYHKQDERLLKHESDSFKCWQFITRFSMHHFFITLYVNSDKSYLLNCHCAMPIKVNLICLIQKSEIIYSKKKNRIHHDCTLATIHNSDVGSLSGPVEEVIFFTTTTNTTELQYLSDGSWLQKVIVLFLLT